MNTQFRRLISVAREAKEALLASWENEKAFIDKQTLSEEGLLSDPVGLTSILLMAIAFRKEPQIITPQDRAHIARITELTLAKLSRWINEDGFIATPLLDSEDTESFFNRDVGYLDSVTWTLSSAILARYAERRGVADFADEIHAIIFDLIGKSLGLLLKAQRDDGTWGFMTDTKAQKSLYFTYTASVSLADFFDYILGEIKEVEQSNDADDSFVYEDAELISYLDATLGMDTRAAATAAREKLQIWLMQDCLPLLPLLSGCTNLTDPVIEKLGLWQHKMNERYSKANINYYNLYYTYYLIDLIVMTATDRRYLELVEAADPRAAEQFAKLKACYEATLNQDDFRYYFGRDHEKNTPTFLFTYLEQAVHSSRNQFMSASRTDADFWDTKDSELTISWLHEDPYVSDTVRRALGQRGVKLSDPAIIPMALRINALYSYYICNQTDITVDRLFDTICDNVSAKTRRSCIAGLWDTIGYSLMITERSVEALVDYYDYLRKFELDKSAPDSVDEGPEASPEVMVETVTVPVKSDFELMFEQKIADYLQSDAGRALLGQLCAPPVAAAEPAPAAPSVDETIRQLEQLQGALGSMDHPLDRFSEDEKERLLYALEGTFLQLCSRSLYEFIANEYMDEGKDGRLASKHHQALSTRFRDLLLRILGDAENPKGNLKELYDRITLA